MSENIFDNHSKTMFGVFEKNRKFKNYFEKFADFFSI